MVQASIHNGSNRLESRSTSDNVDQVVGNGGLSTTVVQHVERRDHVTCVLGGVVHGVTLRVDLGSVALDESGVDGVGKGELGQVLGDVVLLLVQLELRSVAKSTFREDLDDVRLEGKSRDVLVVDEVDLVELDAGLDDLVGNGSGIGESGDILANLVEGEGKVLGKSTGELGLGLLTENNDGGTLGRVSITGRSADFLELGLGTLGDGRVDTTAETLVGGDNNEELATTFGSNSLGVGEDFCGRCKVGVVCLAALVIMLNYSRYESRTYRCWQHRKPWQQP